MEHFIARQPIFDRDNKVFGYELLFRSGLANYFDCPDQDLASSQVIANSFLLFSIEEMAEGARAFLNVTRSVLVKDYATVLPKDFTVVEVLENVEPDQEVLSACRKLKDKGFLLALDDFVYLPRYEQLLELVDIVKIDFLTTSADKRQFCADRLIPRGIKLLAEKVETREDHQQALAMGYSYFQGYFFSKPVIVSRKDIPAFKLPYLRILKEVNKPEIDYQKLARSIQGEVAISYKLLKYTNSVAFGLRYPVTSIVQALALLGEREFKKWLSLISLSGLATGKPGELVIFSLVRGKFCEQAAPLLGMAERHADLFLMGLFSLLDAIMDRPLTEILAEIPVDKDIKAALFGNSGRLFTLLELVLAMEKGEWEKLPELTGKLQVAEALLPEAYIQAVQWARQVMQL